MTTVTWAQLTPGQQAYLDTLARAYPKWVDMVRGQKHYYSSIALCDMNLVEADDTETHDRITPAGIAVWQQGQASSALPRSVWVAEEGEYEDRHTLSVHTTEAGAKAACQRDWQRVVESHKDMDYPAALVWEQDNWRDDIPGYYSQFGPYSVHQYSLVNDAE